MSIAFSQFLQINEFCFQHCVDSGMGSFEDSFNRLRFQMKFFVEFFHERAVCDLIGSTDHNMISTDTTRGKEILFGKFRETQLLMNCCVSTKKSKKLLKNGFSPFTVVRPMAIANWAYHILIDLSIVSLSSKHYPNLSECVF